jgi:hypothetical protein
MQDKPEQTSKVPEGYVPVKVEFTEEESEAITASMNEYASISVAQHGGTGFVTPVKVHDGMMANALAEYVEDLIGSLESCESEEEAQERVQKAIMAQAKAYALHNLPIYVFRLAEMFESLGETTKARDFFRNFLRSQDEFTPDQIDTMFIKQSGFDMQELVAIAKQRVLSLNEYDDPVDQVAFILGFKHDPKFETVLHAIAHGSEPGILDAAEQVRIYGAIDANFHAWTKTVQAIHDEIGSVIPPKLKDEVCKIIIDELDERHYGGQWFERTRIPAEHWINMADYSPLFRTEDSVFCLPTPYFRVLSTIFG